MTIKSSKRLYAHYVELGKSGKTEFARILAREYAKNIAANCLKYRKVDIAKKAPTPEPETPVEKTLAQMNKAELQAKCTELEIEFEDEETKAELIEKIENI